MEKFFGVAQDSAGNVQPGATVTVTDNVGGGTSSLFADDESTPLSNPLTADSNGRFEFKAANGSYDIKVKLGTFIYTLTSLQLFDGVTITSVADINDPSTELNVIAGGDESSMLIAYNGDGRRVYVWESSPSASEDVPHSVDGGASGMWVQIGASAGLSVGDLNVDDLTVTGNLTVSGDTVQLDVATLTVEDPLIELARSNTGGDIVDIGTYGTYNDGSQRYAGLYRDATDGVFKLFTGTTEAPTTTINTGGVGYTAADLAAGALTLSGDLDMGSNDITNAVNVTLTGDLDVSSGDIILNTGWKIDGISSSVMRLQSNNSVNCAVDFYDGLGAINGRLNFLDNNLVIQDASLSTMVDIGTTAVTLAGGVDLTLTSGDLDVTGTATVTGDADFGGQFTLSRSGSTSIKRADTAGLVSVFGGTVNDGANFLLYGSTSGVANTGKLRVGTSDVITWTSSAVNLASGVALQINGTTVIDSSRNITNAGTGSFSGDVTLSADLRPSSGNLIEVNSHLTSCYFSYKGNGTLRGSIGFDTTDEMRVLNSSSSALLTLNATSHNIGASIKYAQVDAATAASTAANFSADYYVPFVANGTTYYMPLMASTW